MELILDAYPHIKRVDILKAIKLCESCFKLNLKLSKNCLLAFIFKYKSNLHGKSAVITFNKTRIRTCNDTIISNTFQRSS